MMAEAEVEKRLADLTERVEILEALMGTDEKRLLVKILATMDDSDKILASALEDLYDRTEALEVKGQ